MQRQTYVPSGQPASARPFEAEGNGHRRAEPGKRRTLMPGSWVEPEPEPSSGLEPKSEPRWGVESEVGAEVGAETRLDTQRWVEEGGVAGPRRNPYLDGDLAKATGATVALAVPAVGIADVAGQGAQLATAGVGVSMATAVGDAASEVVRYLQNGRLNLPKLIGGVMTAGGLLVNVGGMASRVDLARYVGMGVQSVGLGFKSLGEGYRWEDGGVGLLPNGDIAKMAGAALNFPAPILQALALDIQRDLEQRSRAAGGTGVVPPNPRAVAAALLAGGTAAGEFASEVVRGFRDGRVNVPKLAGGLFSFTGAATIAYSVAATSPAARYVGLGLQEIGLAAKSVGEARKWEDTRFQPLPSSRRPSNGTPQRRASTRPTATPAAPAPTAAPPPPAAPTPPAAPAPGVSVAYAAQLTSSSRVRASSASPTRSMPNRIVTPYSSSGRASTRARARSL
ncbi:hypothetical protein ABT336_16880 [Micromonospora sp. NPDC000207]|uniref:hypothetical protein n=1 Tax=Micromonospora sp. NPDC000207 TaxID=3154246 RepID=UPI0033185F30